MNKLTYWVCLAVLVAVTPLIGGFAHADERVIVRRMSGLTLVLDSVTVQIERQAPPQYSGKLPIDLYFAAVRQLLQANNIKEDWMAVPPDAPFISIEIQLEGKKLVLSSAHTLLEKSGQTVMTDNAFEPLNGRDKKTVLAQQSLRQRQHRDAFEKLLRLSAEHLRATLN